MNEDEQLQEQIADIGSRYLQRTLGELVALRDCLDGARQGSMDALKQLGQMAHKIHGSGAMFGFDAVSERASAIERLARSTCTEPTLDTLAVCIDELEEEVHRQVQRREIR